MRKLFFLIFLYPTFLLYSQTENVVIQWDRDGSYHSFPHALYGDGENTLPYLTRKIPWTSQGMLPVAHLKVKRSSPIDPAHLKEINVDHVHSQPGRRDAGQADAV